MTDQARVNWLLQALFTASGTATFTPGTGGGSALAITPPYHLRLMTTAGSNTSNGTEATSGNCPGYTQYGASMGATAFATPSAGQQSNSNSVTWNATGTWTTIPSIEIWDASTAPGLRWLQGALTSSITGVVNGDTVQFAAASVTLNASAW
jgi:hypothetical protein